MKCIVILLLCLAAAQAVRLGGFSKDLIAQEGQCAYGLPRDGRFSKCELGDWWKIGRSHLAKPVKESDIMFTDDFSKLWKEDFTNSSEDSCSATIPGHAVLYQRLTDDILYAHYRLRACARVLGNTPCSVVVKTARNEIYDKLEFSPDADLTCSGSTSDCISECSSAIESISVRYVGALPAHVRIRSPDVGINDWVDAGDFKYGDEATYNLDNLAVWFNNTIDFFPDVELETTFGNNSKVVDLVYFNCSRLSVTPGQRLGDLKQFLVLSLSASEGDFCNWNDLARHRGNCTCENTSAKEVCMYSDKGFVADPSEEFYIGLESGSCSCSFDNICLEQVNGDEGYFGLDWILHEEKKKEDNSTESD